jgi:hypothetical protein
MIIDTGCTTSDLPNTSYWNFNKNIFDEYPHDYLLKEIYKENEIIKWNSNILTCMEILVNTASSQKYFFPPIHIKIGKLNPVEVKSFLVPLDKKSEKSSKLLGLDILSEIKLILSK